jgi:hypothetical protein
MGGSRNRSAACIRQPGINTFKEKLLRQEEVFVLQDRNEGFMQLN